MVLEAAVGIDLGTTYSCVGVLQYGTVEIIANAQGCRTTPSYVAFTDRGRLIGQGAEAQMDLDPTNTIFDAKRLIGRKFSDPVVQQDLKHWPFLVVEEEGRPLIEVVFHGRRLRFSPEEIGAMVLTKMKETAEAYLGYTVKDAVITVPAYFTDAQRQATRNAGAIAGLNVTRILNEPTAAAIAYGMDKRCIKSKSEMNVLIFDLGGGTFDVSVLHIKEGQFQVKSTAGDTHLGGDDFDNRMVDYFVQEFKRKTGKDIGGNKRALRRLRTACERAKRALSVAPEVPVALDSLYEGEDLLTHLTRAKFEDLCADLFELCMVHVRAALSDSKMDKSFIDEIVLVGGCTRIPRIYEMLQQFFDGKELNKSVNPEEAVAYGAAVQAAMLNGDQAENFGEMLLHEIMPLSLGVETAGGIMAPIIPRGTSLPARASKVFTTAEDDQTEVSVRVFEGERPLTADNNLLGRFNLVGIQPAPRGNPQIEVKFDVDVDGILHVSAIDLGSGAHQRVTISDQIHRPVEDVERMVKTATAFKDEDARQRERLEARYRLEAYIYRVEACLVQDEVLATLSEADILRARTLLDSTLAWLQAGPVGRERSEYEGKVRELELGLGRMILVKGGGGPDPRAFMALQKPTPEEMER